MKSLINIIDMLTEIEKETQEPVELVLCMMDDRLVITFIWENGFTYAISTTRTKLENLEISDIWWKLMKEDVLRMFKITDVGEE